MRKELTETSQMERIMRKVTDLLRGDVIVVDDQQAVVLSFTRNIQHNDIAVMFLFVGGKEAGKDECRIYKLDEEIPGFRIVVPCDLNPLQEAQSEKGSSDPYPIPANELGCGDIILHDGVRVVITYAKESKDGAHQSFEGFSLHRERDGTKIKFTKSSDEIVTAFYE